MPEKFNGEMIPAEEGGEKIDSEAEEFSRENKEKLLAAHETALNAVKEWSIDKKPIGDVEGFFKGYGPASKWLKDQLGSLTYDQISKMAEASEDVYWGKQVSNTVDLEKSWLAANLKKYIDKVVTPLIIIKEIGSSLDEKKAKLFAESLRVMMSGTGQGDVASMIHAAKRLDPDMVLNSQLEFFAGKDQPEEYHRTEKGNGPLLAASVSLRLGEKGVIEFSDDENNRGGYGNTTDVVAHIKE